MRFAPPAVLNQAENSERNGDPTSGSAEPRAVIHQLVGKIHSAELFFDRHAGKAFVLLACILGVWAWAASSAKALWFDEQLGLAVSTAPRFRDIWAALALPIDINPPLYHVLARLSIHIFGYSAMAARLPAFLGMLVFLSCLYAFVSRRLRPSYGVLAALLVLCTPVSIYTWEARPYGVVLGLTGLAMVAYQRRLEHKRVAALLICIFTFVCLPLTHYYGVLIIGAFILAELVRALERKQIDWQLLTGMLLAPAVTLFFLRNLVRSQKAAIVHYYSPGTLTSFITGFDLFQIPAWEICSCVVAIGFLYWMQSSRRDEPEEPSSPGFSSPELALAGTLLVLPFVGAIVSILVTHAYSNRYFIAACAGFAILICYLADSFQRRCAGVALVLSVLAAGFVSYNAAQAMKHRHAPASIAGLVSGLGKLDRPIAFEDAKDYVIAREINPAMSAHFYYVAEPTIALKFAGFDSDDKLMLALAKIEPVQVERLDNLSRISDSWIVVPASSSSSGWLTQCLAGMGPGTLQSMQSTSSSDPSAAISGLSAFTTRFPRPDSMTTPWCEAQTPSLSK